MGLGHIPVVSTSTHGPAVPVPSGSRNKLAWKWNVDRQHAPFNLRQLAERALLVLSVVFGKGVVRLLHIPIVLFAVIIRVGLLKITVVSDASRRRR